MKNKEFDVCSTIVTRTCNQSNRQTFCRSWKSWLVGREKNRE